MTKDPDPPGVAADEAAERGLAEARALLHACHTPGGFLASPTDEDNDRHIWGPRRRHPRPARARGTPALPHRRS